MANYDVIADPTPKLSPRPGRLAGRPTIAVLREVLTGLNGTYYTDDRLNRMTYNDLIFAVNGAVAPAFTTSVVTPNPIEDADYDEGFTFAASGSAPITFSVASGTLPAGMTLSSAGVLDGTPTDDGVSNIVVRASNPFGYDDVAVAVTVVAA